MPIAICGCAEVPAYARASIDHIISIRDRKQPEPDLSGFFGQSFEIHRFVFEDTCTPGKDAITEDMMRQLLDVYARIDPSQNVLFHCMAGVSRSTAAAYIYLVSKGLSYEAAYRSICAVRGDLLSSWGVQMSPNLLMIKLADRLLERKGDMLLHATRRQGAAYS